MPLVGENPLAERRILGVRNVALLVAIFAITLSLAGRVFHGGFYLVHTAHSGTHRLVQHRDIDAAEWVSPVCALNLLWSAQHSAAPEPFDPVYSLPYFQSLYNRPPPIS